MNTYKPKRGGHNEHMASMWGFAILAFLMVWAGSGVQFVTDTIDSEPLAWTLYLGVIGLCWRLGVVAQRAPRAVPARVNRRRRTAQ